MSRVALYLPRPTWTSSEAIAAISQAITTEGNAGLRWPERSEHLNLLPSPAQPTLIPSSHGHVESGLHGKPSVLSFAAALERPSRSLFVQKGRH